MMMRDIDRGLLSYIGRVVMLPNERDSYKRNLKRLPIR